MSRGAPPLRFLLLVLGGWICMRGAYLGSHSEPEGLPPLRLAGRAPPTSPLPPPGWGEAAPSPLPEASGPNTAPIFQRPAAVPALFWRPPSARRESAPRTAAAVPAMAIASAPAWSPPPSVAPPFFAPPGIAATASPQATRPPSRWSGSAWIHLRRSSGEALAPGGTLGGSQAGLRINYRINRDVARPLALSGRLYLPLGRPEGAEAAVGLDWRPLAGVPIHLLAERRQRIGREGRSDFALTAYGGVSEQRLPVGLRLDAYAQGGIVGARRRDLFVDGAARVSVRAGPVDLGAGLWGAAQPGVARLDVGPQASVRLPVPGANLRLFADWRFRIAGEAAPASGPTVTLATDF